MRRTVPLTELQQNWDILRRKVANVQAQLPAGAQPSTVMDDFGDVYGMFYAMTSDGFDYQKMMDYAQLVRRTVLDIDGVSSVDIYGERPACIDIDIQESKMANLGVILPRSSSPSADKMQRSIPVTITVGKKEYA